MAKRVFEIAKELNVASKAIVEKCRAEGIPESNIKNHMSTVSAGLEATIREWFSEDASQHTAIETSEKVDLEKVRVAPRRRARETGGTSEPEGDTAVGVAAPPEEESPPIAVEPPKARPIRARPVSPPPTPIEPPGAPETSEEPEPQETPAPIPEAPAPTVIEVAAPTAEAEPAPQDEAAAPPAPAPMNVPHRPKHVKPAGPQLQDRAPVRLSGPKVVRIEAPENIAPPRSQRSDGGPGSYGPRTGGESDDRSRSPRRGPSGPGGPPGAGAAGAGAGAAKRRDGAVPSRRRGASGEDWSGSKFTEQDLAEREARLQRSGGYLKMRRQQAKRATQGDRNAAPAVDGGRVRIVAPFTIKDLSAATGVKGADIVKRLFMQGVMANINSGIDADKAQEIMIDWEIELEVVEAKSAEQQVSDESEQRDVVDLRPRGPVVTIMGHVDHGKTSLLDRIRHANVASGEAGGITQATSAFKVPVTVGEEVKHVVFVDTPGHKAFTEMRSRGATITDIVVLVVAADDGVMPQTIESITHAKAAGVPLVVALNKCDKPEATDGNIQKILGQLAEHGLNCTEWGGDTEVIRTSATSGAGIQDLLEVLDYQAQLLNLKADFGGRARGTVVESRVIEGRGPVANILVQDGSLAVGDFIVAGRAFGRVRDITDDRGNRLKSILPPTPVQVSGLDEIPNAGDRFFVVDTLKKAQQAAEQRRSRDREQQLAQPKVTLSSLFSQMSESEIKEILIVLKADVQGSVDVLKNEIEGVSTDEIKIRVLSAAVGGITESDVILAEASNAIVIGFNVIPSGKARSLADQKNVEVRTYDVIYHITEDVKKAAEGMLEPELRQEVLGHAEVRQVFKITRVGSIAGCYVTDGHIERDALIRVTRGDIVIENDRKLSQLKRFKDDMKDVRSGMECGMKIDGYDDIKEGDVLECYKNIQVKRVL